MPAEGAVIEEDEDDDDSDEKDDEVNRGMETQSQVVKSSNRRTETVVMF